MKSIPHFRSAAPHLLLLPARCSSVALHRRSLMRDDAGLLASMMIIDAFPHLK